MNESLIKLPHLKLGRYRRYHPAAIEAWLSEQAGGPPSGDLHSWRA